MNGNDGNPLAAECSPPRTGSAQSRTLALTIAAAGLEKKATEVEIIDVVGKVDYAEYLVMMSGRTDRQVHAIAQAVQQQLRDERLLPLSVEGISASRWVLLDFNDVVVHVFHEDARCFYDLEALWLDADRISYPDGEPVDSTHCNARVSG